MNFLLYFQGLTHRSRHVTFRLTQPERARYRALAPSALPLSLVRPKALHILAPPPPSQLATPNHTALLTTNALLVPRFRRRNEPLPTLRTSTSHSHSASVRPPTPCGRILGGSIPTGSPSGRVSPPR